MAVEPGSQRRAHEWLADVYSKQPEREALFEQGHPAGAALQAILGAERVADHQDGGGRGGGRPRRGERVTSG